MIARTKLGRSVAVILSMVLSQALSPAAYAATSHLIDPQEVGERLSLRAAERESQVRLVQGVLETAQARQQARVMGLDAAKLHASVPHLSDAELLDLSRRATRVEDVAAGHGGNGGLMVVGLVLLLAGIAVLAAVGDYDDGYYYEDDCYCY